MFETWRRLKLKRAFANYLSPQMADRIADSDFDLLVVTRLEDGESGYDYDRVYAPVLGTGVGCDVVPCRVDDFLREAESPTGLVREVLQTGVSLYEKPKARQPAPARG